MPARTIFCQGAPVDEEEWPVETSNGGDGCRLVGIGTGAEDGDTELRSAAPPLQIGSQV